MTALISKKSFNEVVVSRISPPNHRVETRTFLFITLTLLCIARHKIVEVAKLYCKYQMYLSKSLLR